MPCIHHHGYRTRSVPEPVMGESVYQMCQNRVWGCRPTVVILFQIREVGQVYKEAAAANVAVKGTYGTGLGEEMMIWIPVISCIRGYAEALESNCQPKHGPVRKRKNGQYVVDAFPLGCELLSVWPPQVVTPDSN